MASATTFSGLGHSYAILEAWLPFLCSITKAKPEAEPTAETVMKQATELRDRCLAFATTTYVGQPLSPVIESCIISITKVTKALLENPIPPAELRFADLALRLITPLTTSFDTFPSSCSATPRISEEEHKTKISALKAHHDAFQESLSKTDDYGSALIKALAEDVMQIVKKAEIQSIRAIRRSLIYEISESLGSLEAFVISKDLSDPASLTAALKSCKDIYDLCSGLDKEIEYLDDDLLRAHAQIVRQKETIRSTIFEKYFANTRALLPVALAASYSKGQETILNALSKISESLTFTRTFEGLCRTMFGAYEGPSDITDLIVDLLIHRAHLISAQLEHKLEFMEKTHADFPSLAGLPIERQERLITILSAFKDEFRQLQRCGIETGKGLPKEVSERLSGISTRFILLRDLKSPESNDHSSEKV